MFKIFLPALQRAGQHSAECVLNAAICSGFPAMCGDLPAMCGGSPAVRGLMAARTLIAALPVRAGREPSRWDGKEEI